MADKHKRLGAAVVGENGRQVLAVEASRQPVVVDRCTRIELGGGDLGRLARTHEGASHDGVGCYRDPDQQPRASCDNGTAFVGQRALLVGPVPPGPRDGWSVTQKEVLTKDGLGMDFVSFEDETALYETVLFPDVYKKYRNLLFEQRPLIVDGSVMEDQGALNVEVKSLMAAV